jgi:hypothetical protein
MLAHAWAARYRNGIQIIAKQNADIGRAALAARHRAPRQTPTQDGYDDASWQSRRNGVATARQRRVM